MSVNFSLSLSDLLLIPKFAKAFGENDKKTMYAILFENGMDVSGEVEEVVCLHRNLQGKAVNCLRFESFERSDPEWMRSGNASWEQRVALTGDADLRFELRAMGSQGSISGEQCKQIAKSKIKVENNI